MPVAPIGRAEICARDAARKQLRFLGVRLRQDDPELVAPDAAGDVRGAHDREQPLGRLREDGVAGQVADAVVDRLEVVEVEQDQREPPLVAVRARYLAGERLVEVAAVVQARERVEIREGPSLGVAPRVLEPTGSPSARIGKTTPERTTEAEPSGMRCLDRLGEIPHGVVHPGGDACHRMRHLGVRRPADTPKRDRRPGCSENRDPERSK